MRDERCSETWHSESRCKHHFLSLPHTILYIRAATRNACGALEKDREYFVNLQKDGGLTHPAVTGYLLGKLSIAAEPPRRQILLIHAPVTIHQASHCLVQYWQVVYMGPCTALALTVHVCATAAV